jgi:hypothetical protein
MAKAHESGKSAGEPQQALFQLVEPPNAYRKAVQVVHSKPRAPMSLMQRKTSNAWLKNAVQTEPDEEGYWTISIAAMAKDIGFDSNNRAYLRESSLELMRIVFEWDVIAPMHKKGTTWKASVLFPDVEMRSDVMRYRISSQLRDQVLNPEIWAMIDMNHVRKFKRASSLALYEQCVRFEKVGRTTPVQWEHLRDIILGESAEAKIYQEYKFFKNRVLLPSIAEINSLSDIEVELVQNKEGRKVTTLQFAVQKKSEYREENPVDEEAMEAIGMVAKLGVPGSEAKKLAKQWSAKELRAAVEYTTKRMHEKKGPKIENPAAYFRQALNNRWASVADAEVKRETVASAQPTAANHLDDMYAAERMAESEKYFAELDAPDQDALIERYNQGQDLKGLKLSKEKISKAASAAFFRWLANDTWGAPSTAQLLAFANKLAAASRR